MRIKFKPAFARISLVSLELVSQFIIKFEPKFLHLKKTWTPQKR